MERCVGLGRKPEPTPPTRSVVEFANVAEDRIIALGAAAGFDRRRRVLPHHNDEEDQMRNFKVMLVLAVTFLTGAAVGVVVAKSRPVDSSLYVGQQPAAAASNLLELAMVQAGKGSWERIKVARVYYLSGDTAEGQAVFDQITSKQEDPSDLVRIGRVYEQAGEWDKAKEMFDKVLQAKPEDEDWLAEIGAYYNLHGEREHAEELFQRSFAEDSGNERNTSAIAGSYVGVHPEY